MVDLRLESGTRIAALIRERNSFGQQAVLGKFVRVMAITFTIAAVSIVVGPYWFDVVYPVVAVWVLLPLLLGARRAIQAVQLALPAQSRR